MKTDKAKLRLLYGLIGLTLLISIAAGAYGWWINWQATQQLQTLQKQAKDGEGQSADVVPTEDKPRTDTYQVAPDQPRLLSIPSLNVAARVRSVGVDTNNMLLSPINIYDVGWYSSSAKPGDTTGALLIDGHVSGPTQHGVFYDLKKLAVGDGITIERGDGRQFQFHVVGREQVDADKVDMSKLLRSSDAGKLGLNLITCGGSFDYAANQYRQRVIVYAVID